MNTTFLDTESTELRLGGLLTSAAVTRWIGAKSSSGAGPAS